MREVDLTPLVGVISDRALKELEADLVRQRVPYRMSGLNLHSDDPAGQCERYIAMSPSLADEGSDATLDALEAVMKNDPEVAELNKVYDDIPWDEGAPTPLAWSHDNERYTKAWNDQRRYQGTAGDFARQARHAYRVGFGKHVTENWFMGDQPGVGKTLTVEEAARRLSMPKGVRTPIIHTMTHGEVDRTIIERLQSKSRLVRELSDGAAETSREASHVGHVTGRSNGRLYRPNSDERRIDESHDGERQGKDESEVFVRAARPIGHSYGFGSPDEGHSPLGKAGGGRVLNHILNAEVVSAAGGARVKLSLGVNFKPYDGGYSATSDEMTRLINELIHARDKAVAANRKPTPFWKTP